MQLELELRWYTDQLGKLEYLSGCGCIVVVEWAFNHTHFAFILEIKLLLLDSSV